MIVKNILNKLIYKFGNKVSKSLTILDKYISNKNQVSICPLIIFGPARSGTTLLTQLLISTGIFFSTNNFIASFPHSPLLATRAWRVLAKGHQNTKDRFKSYYGKSEGLGGYNQGHTIWQRWFDVNDTNRNLNKVQRTEFLRTINGLSNIAGKPIALKWPGFSAHAEALTNCLPNAMYVYIDRSTLALAKSIYQGRIELNGDPKIPISRAPYNFHLNPHENPVDDILRYINSVRDATQYALSNIPDNNKVFLSYERICLSPFTALKEIVLKHSAIRLAALKKNSLYYKVLRTIKKNEAKFFENLESALPDFKISHGPKLNSSIENEFCNKINRKSKLIR